MKETLQLLFSFLPWILFLLLSGHTLTSLALSLVISASVAVVMALMKFQRGILTWMSILYFAVALIMVVWQKNMWFISHISFLANGFLLFVTVAGMLVGRPFTEEYAKREVPEELRNSARFVKSCYITTTLWMLIFLLNFLLEYLKEGSNATHLLVFINYALLLSGVFITRVYSGISRARRMKNTSCHNLQNPV